MVLVKDHTSALNSHVPSLSVKVTYIHRVPTTCRQKVEGGGGELINMYGNASSVKSMVFTQTY